jgi:hypothetical protein
MKNNNVLQRYIENILLEIASIGKQSNFKLEEEIESLERRLIHMQTHENY